MNTETIVFALASALAIVFSLVMLFQRKPVKSVLSLVVTFFGLAILSVLLAAPFIAALQVIVYAGAILVLFLFVIMLLNLEQEAADKETRKIHFYLGILAVLGLGGLVTGLTLRAGNPPVPAGNGPFLIPAKDEIPLLGKVLFTDYLLAFEALSVLLLLAAVGALILSKRRFE
ncbi:MAG: NADH-quinone oxidoreductase subunit J [Thermoanaerobaculia bacterium]|nr:NADH-quinone oxidoreductase subunit J [Thermoanaerobaculia bacterium]